MDIEKFAINSVVNAPGAAQAQTVQAVQWLVVPRHPQRFDDVAALLRQAGLSVSRRSDWAGAPEPADVWLGDSLGEMALYYALADCALLGGSFAPLGGQNLIEAIAAGCPVVMGPHTFNFANAATTALHHGAALRVQDMAQGVQTAVALAGTAQDIAAMKAAGAQWLAQSSGAVQRTAQAVVRLLGWGSEP